MDIILIGRIAEDGILSLLNGEGRKILSDYPARYISEGIAGLEAEFGDEKCMKMLDTYGADVFVVGKQGIFSALYKLGSTYGIGLRVDQKKIPVRQFCTEMADRLDINPYNISSLGCILVCTTDGSRLVAELLDAGYEAELIGYTTDDKACCAVTGQGLTYLSPDMNGGKEDLT